MFEEARARIHDADLHSESLREASDSSALIRVLGFEILLKYVLSAYSPATFVNSNKLTTQISLVSFARMR